MAPKQYKSRLHLLIAKRAPTVVIVQRKRAKLFHIVIVDADSRRVEEGSWFRGKLYALRCDVSFDGKHMVYLSGVTDHHVQSAEMLDHIVALVEAKAAELEAASLPQAAE